MTPAVHAEIDNVDPEVPEVRQAIKALGSQLKQELRQAMAAGGPVAAVKVCHTRAAAIAAAVSAETQWEIGRTSLKWRNPNNAPDEWEQQTLRQFEQRKAAGEAVAKLEAMKTTNEGFRYMKAIPTQGLCLTCHGTEIKPEIASELQRLYPEDNATGFRLGDIRGAFTMMQRTN